MATSKIISIKSDPKKCIDYVKDKTKTIVNDENLDSIAALTYIVNSTKTTHGQNILVDGVGCSATKADLEFKLREAEYHSQTQEVMKDGKTANQAFHLIQSFSEEDCKKKTPEELHEIGMEFAKRVTGGHFQAVVATHINTLHWHNHIVICAYAQDGPYKFINNKEGYRKIREINDELCKENGLSIIIPQQLNKVANYYEWEQIQNGSSWKEQIRQDIRSTMELSKDWSEYEKIMKNAGYEITFNKNSISYKAPGALHAVRDIKLGNAYTSDALEEYWTKEKNKEITKKIQRTNHTSNYISQYTDSGRKRTLLEMIILKIINKLKKMLNEEMDEEKKVNISYKLQSMIDTQKFIRENKITDMSELKQQVGNIGIQLNNAKIELEAINSECFNLSNTLDKVERYLEMKELLEASGVDVNRLMKTEYSEEEKREARAELNPLTNTQKKILYKALEDNPDLKIKYKFSELTKEEGQAIIDYIKGKTSEKSSLIISKEEFNQNRKNINSHKSLSKIPATAAQKVMINKYVNDNNIALKKQISTKLEATEFLDYIQGKTTKVPSVILTDRDEYISNFSPENLDIINEYLTLQDIYYKLEFNKPGIKGEYEAKLDDLRNQKFQKQLEINEAGKRYRDMKLIEAKVKEINEEKNQEDLIDVEANKEKTQGRTTEEKEK